jgi:hypothetical protein
MDNQGGTAALQIDSNLVDFATASGQQVRKALLVLEPQSKVPMSEVEIFSSIVSLQMLT